MVCIKCGNIVKYRHKKILILAKGFKGAHSRLFRTAQSQIWKSLTYSYIGLKKNKSNFKHLWVLRINAIIRQPGFSYSKFRAVLKRNSIQLNLKMLNQLYFLDRRTFCKISKVLPK